MVLMRLSVCLCACLSGATPKFTNNSYLIRKSRVDPSFLFKSKVKVHTYFILYMNHGWTFELWVNIWIMGELLKHWLTFNYGWPFELWVNFWIMSDLFMDSTQLEHGGGQAKLFIGFTHISSQMINLMGKFLHTKKYNHIHWTFTYQMDTLDL